MALKLCSKLMHMCPATTEYFYKDKHRPDGWDLWCKKCRKVWGTLRPNRHFSDSHSGPIVLTLPVTQRFPVTSCFNSGTRKMADQAVKAGRLVVVTNRYNGSTWLWREWVKVKWHSFDQFFKEVFNL